MMVRSGYEDVLPPQDVWHQGEQEACHTQLEL
jgi:hypothetical protein